VQLATAEESDADKGAEVVLQVGRIDAAADPLDACM